MDKTEAWMVQFPRLLAIKKAATSLLLNSPSNTELPYKFGAEVKDNADEEAAPLRLTLERKSNLRKTMGFIFLFFLLEVSKQTLNYKLANHNSGQYPVPTSVIMFCTELCKLALILIVSLSLRYPVKMYRPSIRFSLPALCYFITNILYLGAIRTVPPPLWMVLIQTRTLYTAIVYKVVFGRSVKPLQVLGCLLIVISIPIAKVTELADSGKTENLTTYIIIVSQGCAMLSTAAAVSVEILLKNDRRSFSEQQVWLYSWGALYTTLIIPATVPLATLTHQFKSLDASDIVLLCSAVLAAALAGLCIPIIVKNLDTIVKDYLAAANNLLLSVAIALIFPSLFSFSPIFLCSLLVLFLGIFLYERCGDHSPPSSPTSKTNTFFQFDKIINKKKMSLEPTII